jgi:hypothetical protein
MTQQSTKQKKAPDLATEAKRTRRRKERTNNQRQELSHRIRHAAEEERKNQPTTNQTVATATAAN